MDNASISTTDVVRLKRTGLSLLGLSEFRRQVAAIRPARFPDSP